MRDKCDQENIRKGGMRNTYGTTFIVPHLGRSVEVEPALFSRFEYEIDIAWLSEHATACFELCDDRLEDVSFLE